jgi:hypothetical protein
LGSRSRGGRSQSFSTAIQPHETCSPSGCGRPRVPVCPPIGVGTEPDTTRGKMLPAGSLVVLPAGAPHYVFVEEGSVAQINSTGPWGRTFVDLAGNPVE